MPDEKLTQLIGDTLTPIITIATGIGVGQSDVHNHFTDPVFVGLCKDYISMAVAMGGFILLIYNTFIKKRKNAVGRKSN
jgi:hypothetical protein